MRKCYRFGIWLAAIAPITALANGTIPIDFAYAPLAGCFVAIVAGAICWDQRYDKVGVITASVLLLAMAMPFIANSGASEAGLRLGWKAIGEHAAILLFAWALPAFAITLIPILMVAATIRFYSQKSKNESDDAP